MVIMGFQNPETAYTSLDLERGADGRESAQDGSRFSNGQVKLLNVKDFSGFHEKILSEMTVNLESNFSSALCGEGLADKKMERGPGFDHLQKKMDLGTPRKKASERSPKPPRPPKSFSLDAADRKLIEEISRLAKLKQARNERIRALKKMNASEAESGSNLGAIIVTIFFFLIFLWQGCTYCLVYKFVTHEDPFASGQIVDSLRPSRY